MDITSPSHIGVQTWGGVNNNTLNHMLKETFISDAQLNATVDLMLKFAYLAKEGEKIEYESLDQYYSWRLEYWQKKEHNKNISVFGQPEQQLYN